jgi:hypothetical protein
MNALSVFARRCMSSRGPEPVVQSCSRQFGQLLSCGLHFWGVELKTVRQWGHSTSTARMSVRLTTMRSSIVTFPPRSPCDNLALLRPAPHRGLISLDLDEVQQKNVAGLNLRPAMTKHSKSELSGVPQGRTKTHRPPRPPFPQTSLARVLWRDKWLWSRASPQPPVEAPLSVPHCGGTSFDVLCP